MLDTHDKSAFESALGSVFRMDGDGLDAADIRLVACDSKLDTPQQACFSLLFNAPADTAPVQGVRRLRHPELGEMEIFLVPIKKTETELVFEAVFNRLRS